MPDAAEYMATVAASDDGRRYKRRALALLDVPPGAVVVDLGCGPGTDLGDLVRSAGAAGRVLGVDADPAMLARAAGSGAELALADLHALPLAGGSVDRARTDRVLQHVADPTRVLGEVARVLRPGGRAVFAEPDWTTLTVDSDVRAGSEALRAYIVDHQVRNASIGTALPRLSAAAGLRVADVRADVALFTDLAAADVVLGLTRVSARAVAAGRMTGHLARAWLDSLANRPFTACATLLLVAVEKPVPPSAT